MEVAGGWLVFGRRGGRKEVIREGVKVIRAEVIGGQSPDTLRVFIFEIGNNCTPTHFLREWKTGMVSDYCCFRTSRGETETVRLVGWSVAL